MKTITPFIILLFFSLQTLQAQTNTPGGVKGAILWGMAERQNNNSSFRIHFPGSPTTDHSATVERPFLREVGSDTDHHSPSVPEWGHHQVA